MTPAERAALKAEMLRELGAIWKANGFLDDNVEKRAAELEAEAAQDRAAMPAGPSKEWCLQAARREGDSDATTGPMIAGEKLLRGFEAMRKFVEMFDLWENSFDHMPSDLKRARIAIEEARKP